MKFAMEDEDEKYIAITHFINPHQFWYTCTENANESANNKVCDLEEKLTKRYINSLMGKTRHFTPVEGSIVAVQYMANKGKFIRARVEEKLTKPYTKSASYIVWAIDHGFPFETSDEHIRYLPEEFSESIDRVRCGGIAKIVPAEEEFDFFKQCTELEIKKKWSTYACDTLERMLSDAASIAFSEQKYINGHFWGDLHVVNHRGKLFRASDYLINEKLAIRNADKFKEFCIKSNSTQMPVWLSNSGNSKYGKNKCPSMESSPKVDIQGSIPNQNEFRSAKLKVAAWSTHNEKATYSDLGTSRREGSVVSANLYDTDLEDSVSKIGCVEEELDKMSLTNRGIHKKSNQTSPPKPTLTDFGVFEENPVEDNNQNIRDSLSLDNFSSVSKQQNSHSKFLLEMRKKHISNQKAKLAEKESQQDIEAASNKSYKSDITETELKSDKMNEHSSDKDKSLSNIIPIQSDMKVRSVDRTRYLKFMRMNCAQSKLSENETETVVSSKSSNSKIQKNCSQRMENVMPAGFDLANLNTYRDRNHWHRKTTTRNEKEKISHSSDSENQNQDFRFTRPNRDKYKTCKSQVHQTETKELNITKSSDINSLSSPEPVKIKQDYVSKKSDCSLTAGKNLMPTMKRSGFELLNKTISSVFVEENNSDINPQCSKSQKHALFSHSKKASNKDTSDFSEQEENSDKNFNYSQIKNSALSMKQKIRRTTSNNDASFFEELVSNSNCSKTQNPVFPVHLKRGANDDFSCFDEENNFDCNTYNFKTENSVLINTKNLKTASNKDTSLFDVKNDSKLKWNCSKTEENLLLTHSKAASSFWEEKKNTNFDSKCSQTKNLFSQKKDQKNLQDALLDDKLKKSDLSSNFSNTVNNNTGFFDEADSFDFDLQRFNTEDSVLSDSSESSADSEYNSALSSLDEPTQEENNLQKISRNEVKTIKTIKENIKTPAKIEKKSNKLYNNLSDNQSKKSDQEQMILSHEDRLIRTKFTENLVLAHSQIQLYTAEKLENVFLAPSVAEEMKRMFINKVFRVQSYAWSHMIGGNGLFIVNAPKSGKTYSYIPPLCSAITFDIENSAVPSTYGPMAIVLVPSTDHAVEIGNICSRLLSRLDHAESKTVISYGLQNLIHSKVQLMEACSILVTTPSNILRLMQDNESTDPLFDPNRIKYLIIDDIDEMLLRPEEDFYAVFKKLFGLVPKINKSKKLLPQLVVTSSVYHPIFKKLIPISNQPLLLIGDFLEAAVYGRANIVIKLCPKEEKFSLVLNFIKIHSILHEPLIIVCNGESDVLYLVENLISRGISSIGFHSKSSTSARQQIEDWKVQYNPMKVLICSDDVFSELEIRNAQNLIHFSLAKTWTKFTLRFISLLNIYENLVVEGFDGPPPEKRATSLVLLDEDNNAELPRLMEFLKTHNQIERVHPDVIELSRRIQMQREMKRCSESTQLCSSLFEFGQCDNARCENRHVLATTDLNQENELLQSGDLRLLVLNVFSPTHFSARLLEHRSTKSSKWCAVRQSNKAAYFAIRFNSFYCFEPNNLKMHWPVKANDLCVCKRNDTFYRARVLDASKIKSTNIIQSVQIKIKLIDIGDVVYTKSDELYICYDQFRDFPAQAIDIRLMGVVPSDNERVWDSTTTNHVKLLIKDNLGENECVYASISFSLGDAIWVSNVAIMEQLPTLRNSAYKVSLKRHLVNKKYGIMDKNVVTKIHNIIEEQGFGFILGNTESFNSVNNSIQSEDSAYRFEEKIPKPMETKHTQDIDPTIISKPKTSNRISMLNNYSVQSSDNKDSEYDGDSSELSKNETSDLEECSTNKSDKSAVETKESESPLPPVCSMNEFIKCIQRSIQLDVEEFDNKDENKIRDLQKFTQETDEICNAFINKNKNEVREKKEQQENCVVVDDNRKISTKAKEQIQNISKMKKFQQKQKQQKTFLPRLFNLYPRPPTVWYETNYLIILTIEAPEIDDYYLEVTKSTLFFSAYVDGVPKVLLLHFLGTVEPNLVSHEIRGLNVVVRLVKTLFVKWPRLLKQAEKMPWLKYNFNMINAKEMGDLLPQQFLSNVINKNAAKNSDESSINSDDDEYEHYKTFTPIVNKEDIHDPLASEM